MRGYDQWKTASPYDDCDEYCPRCGADPDAKDYPEMSDEDQEQVWYDDGFCSKACYDEYQKDCAYDGLNMPRYRRISDEQREYIDSLEKRAMEAMAKKREQAKTNHITIDQLFENTPPGDFEWEQDEAGDWHVYNCGEKDCPIGWHTIAYGMNLRRKNDKKEIELWSVDSDGNWDFDTGWESGQDPTYVLELITMQTNDYFYGWFQYWIDCAETGQDVLDQASDTHWTVENYIKFAEDNLNYLEM